MFTLKKMELSVHDRGEKLEDKNLIFCDLIFLYNNSFRNSWCDTYSQDQNTHAVHHLVNPSFPPSAGGAVWGGGGQVFQGWWVVTILIWNTTNSFGEVPASPLHLIAIFQLAHVCKFPTEWIPISIFFCQVAKKFFPPNRLFWQLSCWRGNWMLI